MEKMRRIVSWSSVPGGLAGIALGAVLLLFTNTAAAQYDDYVGTENCAMSGCHDDTWNKRLTSPHSRMLMKAEDARNRGIPLPEGLDWDDITYVIGGSRNKVLYLDDEGNIYTPSGGENQYNVLTGNWADYLAGETKPYDCGECHTTAWIADEDAATDGDLSDNQDGLPGIHGTFFAGGVQCEQCHGPGFTMQVDSSAEACGECHSRGSLDAIEASDGYIHNNAQYNELLASPHAVFDCTRCHNPHEKAEFSIWKEGEREWGPDEGEGAQCGVDCHSDKMASFMENSMYDYGVECKDCHMPFATLAAESLGPFQGDVKTHIFRINTDPTASMFTQDGSAVALDQDGKAAVTLDFACKRCHQTAALEELAKYAEGFHGRTDGNLLGIGIDPGLSGHWWDANRAGEGFMMEVAYVGDQLFLFVSFYAYDAEGNRTYLFAQGFADGTSLTVPVEIVLPAGAKWGDEFDPNDIPLPRPAWGTGSFTFGPNCATASFTFTANQDALDQGYTDISGNLTRDLLEVGVVCPTFVNNPNK